MRRLCRLACLGFLAAWAIAAAAPPAQSGAWTRTRGDGQAIVTTARRIAPAGTMFGGVADRDASISQAYLEYGLTDELTLGGKFYVEISTTDLERGSAALGGFLRKRVWQDGQGSVASVEAGYAYPVDPLLGGLFALAEPGAVPEAHLAGLFGRGWGDVWSGGFVSAGAAYHWRGEGLADEIRAELTGGYRPWRRLMGMVSLYGLAPLAGGTDASLKLAPSVAFTMWPFIEKNEKKPIDPIKPSTIQLGVSYNLLQPREGLGVWISIWRGF